MGHIAEMYFDIEECPYCKGTKLKAIITKTDIAYFDDGKYWIDEMESDFPDDVSIICCDCNKEIENEKDI